MPDNDPVRQEAGRQVILALQRLGASAAIRALPRRELSAAVGEDGSTPTFEAAIWTSSPLASYDPDFLARVFGSHPAAAADLNLAGYRSPVFDDLARRIGSTVDPAARKAVVADALRLLATDAPAVPLFFSTGVFAFRPAAYDSWVFVKGSGIFDKRSFVDPAAGVPATTTAGPAPPVTRPGASRAGVPVFGVAALALVGVALVIGILAALRGRQRRA